MALQIARSRAVSLRRYYRVEMDLDQNSVSVSYFGPEGTYIPDDEVREVRLRRGIIEDVVSDEDGTVIVGFRYRLLTENVNPDEGLPENTNLGVRIDGTLYDADGNKLWTRIFGPANSFASAHSVATDPAGGAGQAGNDPEAPQDRGGGRPAHQAEQFGPSLWFPR